MSRAREPIRMRRTRVVFDANGEVIEYELLPRGRPRRLVEADEELELRALAGLAWERRNTAAIRETTDAIEDWHDRRHIRELERKQRSRAAVLQVLRETNPDRRKP